MKKALTLHDREKVQKPFKACYALAGSACLRFFTCLLTMP